MGSAEDEDVSGADIMQLVERLSRLLRARDHQDGLNPAQREALRYLGRSNRFSNSPIGLARYLGATKGTISQTIKALERKGLLSKRLRPDSGKTMELKLTAEGEAALARDPWLEVARAADQLGGKTRRRMQRGLDDLLRAELARHGASSFGTCLSCRFFREQEGTEASGGPHHCLHFKTGLPATATGQICAHHQPRD